MRNENKLNTFFLPAEVLKFITNAGEWEYMLFEGNVFFISMDKSGSDNIRAQRAIS